VVGSPTRKEHCHQIHMLVCTPLIVPPHSSLAGTLCCCAGLGGGLTHQEVAVIHGAMDLTNKTALSAMTPIHKVGAGRSACCHAHYCCSYSASSPVAFSVLQMHLTCLE
jgi:hypothetical protein